VTISKTPAENRHPHAIHAASLITQSSQPVRSGAPKVTAKQSAVMIGRFIHVCLVGGLILLVGGCGRSPTGGVVQVGGPPKSRAGCPKITSWALAPLVTSVGGQIHLHGAAVATTDAGTGVVVEWGAVRGRIEAPLPDTTFTCLVGGNQAVTLTASDGKCDEVATFSVFCASPSCGDGRLDPGEQCDPPNGTTCLDGCSLPCGDGLIEPGEQCDPPDGTTCSASCRFLNPAYGN
jgi:cysteine-rich repeat protein